jgi:predicted TIM-barrel fold metal-dependent hydrolase
MIIDAHCHLTAELPAADLVKTMDAGGVDRAVLLAPGLQPVAPAGPAQTISLLSAEGPARLSLPDLSIRNLLSPFSPLGRFRYAGLIEGGLLRTTRGFLRVISTPDNEPVAEAARRHPGRFIPFAFVNPNDPTHTTILEHYLARGFRGAKVNAWFHAVDLRATMGRIARRCGEAGLPVLLHLGGTRQTGWAIFDLIDRYPNTNFIIAHAGLPCYAWLWRACRIHPNLYFDLSGPYMTPALVGCIAGKVPPGRLLFASGGPHGLRTADGEHSYAVGKRWIFALDVSDEARSAILGGTLLRLTGLSTETPIAASGSRGGRYSSQSGR